jgi:pimeloyl-ACP methyl ester carboxylesterase
MHVFYLHGFASSARSSKAAFLARQLEAHGITLHTPDFNQPDFSTLTISRMVRQVEEAIDALPAGPVALIGSSLGGFVAVQAALARAARVSRLILLAPALDFAGRRMRSLGGTTIEDWRRTGTLPIFHYGFGRMMEVHYDLYADARKYDASRAALPIPVQIFQGRLDDTVDPAAVKEWADARAGVELHMLEDGHQLTASLDTIWPEIQRFLGLGQARPA